MRRTTMACDRCRQHAGQRTCARRAGDLWHERRLVWTHRADDTEQRRDHSDAESQQPPVSSARGARDAAVSPPHRQSCDPSRRRAGRSRRRESPRQDRVPYHRDGLAVCIVFHRIRVSPRAHRPLHGTSRWCVGDATGASACMDLRRTTGTCARPHPRSRPEVHSSFDPCFKPGGYESFAHESERLKRLQSWTDSFEPSVPSVSIGC